MRQTIAALLLNNSSVKVIACLFGYFYWSLLSDLYLIEARYWVPVTVASQNHLIYRAPAQALVTLRGLRKNIRSLDSSLLEIIIPESNLVSGKNFITVTAKHMALPSCISLVNYIPVNFIIETRPESTQDPVTLASKPYEYNQPLWN
jgi:hypothetical protein